MYIYIYIHVFTYLYLSLSLSLSLCIHIYIYIHIHIYMCMRVYIYIYIYIYTHICTLRLLALLGGRRVAQRRQLLLAQAPRARFSCSFAYFLVRFNVISFLYTCIFLYFIFMFLGSSPRLLAQASIGWHYLSNPACLMRPHVFSTALLV